MKLFIFFVIAFALFFSALGNRRASHGEACNRITRCDSRSSLTCKNGICECMIPETMRFDNRQGGRSGRCSVLAGERCIFTAVEGEKVERSWREEMPCVESAICQDGFCTCFPGFYENSNGTCSMKKNHGEECEANNACRDDQHLVCNNGRCDCNSTVSTLDFSRGVCVRLAGQPCGEFPLCVNNAHCRASSESFYDETETLVGESTCVCEDGFFANENGACERKRSFGAPCQSDSYCVNEGHIRLTCNGETCGCDSKVSLYDSSSNMCRTRAGAPCDIFPYCVENSECDTDFYTSQGKCRCLLDFFQTKNGTCDQRRFHGEQCESDENCRHGLKCNGQNSLCQCDTSKSIYDSRKRKCVGLANSPCDDTDSCITNSECGWRTESEKQCICQHGYSQSKNGSCLASHDVSCTDHWAFACNHEQGLVCKDGKCTCKYEKFQRFLPSFQKCVSEAGGPCDETVPCIRNSHCVENGVGFPKCECDNGFVEVDGECQLSIGQSCNVTFEPLTNNEFPKCDSVAPLFCIEGTCQCGPLQVYDLEKQKCRGKVGSICYVDQNAITGENNSDCVVGATCVKRRSVKSSKGVCKCSYGWKPKKDGRCTPVKGLLSEDPLSDGNALNFTAILI